MSAAPILALVPTYMEAGTICRLLAEIRGRLPQARVLVVDDRSPDGTAALVRERYRGDAAVEVVTRDGPRGYAAAMAEGVRRFLAGDAGWLITLDADLSHDPAVMDRLLARCGERGLVIGSRYLRGAPRAAWALARMRTSILGNHYVRLVTGLPVADCTSGFRCYSRAALAAVDLGRLRARGFAFQVEVLHAVWLSGQPIEEIPIQYRDRLAGESKLTPAIITESLRVPWQLARRGRGPARVVRASPAVGARDAS